MSESQVRNHSLGLRIWHWLDGGVVIGLIVTFFLRDALVSHARYFAGRLGQQGIPVSDTVSRPIIHEMVDALWSWHVYLGYALTALFLLRLILLFTDKRNPALEFWRSFRMLRTHFDFRDLHNAGVRTSYFAFYLLQFFMIVTGMLLNFDRALGLGKDFRHTVNEAHEAVMWFFLVFVVAHVVGVFLAENTGDPGIASAMINGGRGGPALESSEAPGARKPGR